ncbi:peripheral plasma membrane protein CASK-like isoform X2 [Gordionus sp. m RMFG-2023]
MIFEYLEGPDICQEIIRRASSGYVYSEAVASHYLKQLLEALKYCHALGVTHNDLKLECLLLACRGQDSAAPLKLGGFGYAFKGKGHQNSSQNINSNSSDSNSSGKKPFIKMKRTPKTTTTIISIHDDPENASLTPSDEERVPHFPSPELLLSNSIKKHFCPQTGQTDTSNYNEYNKKLNPEATDYKLPKTWKTDNNEKEENLKLEDCKVEEMEEIGKSDMWACGIILFVLLGGNLPFFGTKDMIHAQIIKGQFKMKPKQWDKVSDTAKDLVKKLLDTDPAKRISAQQALLHPWIAEREKHAKKTHLYDSVEELKKFNLRRKLKGTLHNSVTCCKLNNFYGDPSIDGLMKSKIVEEVYTPSPVIIKSAIPDSSTDIKKRFIMNGGNNSDQHYCPFTPPNASSRRISNENNMIDISAKDLSDQEDDDILTKRLLHSTLENKKLHSLLDLYDKIYCKRKNLPHTNPPSDLVELSFSVLEAINSPTFNPNHDKRLFHLCQELNKILNKSHIRAILKTSDIVAHEIYSSQTTESTPTTIQITQTYPDSGYPTFSDSPNSLNNQNYLSSNFPAKSTHLKNSNQSKLPNGILYHQNELLSSPPGIPDYDSSDGLICPSIKTCHTINNMVSNSPGIKNIENIDRNNYNNALRDDQIVGNIMTGNILHSSSPGCVGVGNRIKVATFEKKPHEAMGITLKLNEGNKCVIARVMYGGLAYRQGNLGVGDHILEINGKDVSEQNVQTLQCLLSQAQGQVTLKIQSSTNISSSILSSMNTPSSYISTNLGYSSPVPNPNYNSNIQRSLISSDSNYPLEDRTGAGNKNLEGNTGMNGGRSFYHYSGGHTYVKACFDYDASSDEQNPCPQAGLSFSVGDILKINSKYDIDWWQATKVLDINKLNYGDQSFPDVDSALSSLQNIVTDNPNQNVNQFISGLIPSPELQEWKTACENMEKNKQDVTPSINCAWFLFPTYKKSIPSSSSNSILNGHHTNTHSEGMLNTHFLHYHKSSNSNKDKYLVKHNAVFDQLDVVTYEEVCFVENFRYKTLVLLGAHGVGRRHIKNTLIANHPSLFAYPIPHTTRKPRPDEKNGKNYYFVASPELMSKDISNNDYLEYGSHEGSLYGTKLSTVKDILGSGKMAILDVEPQALKTLRTAQYAPFIIFIAAPSLTDFPDADGSLERLIVESEYLSQTYRHTFDLFIVNDDIDKTIAILERKIFHLLRDHSFQDNTNNKIINNSSNIEEKNFNYCEDIGQLSVRNGHWVPVNWVY